MNLDQVIKLVNSRTSEVADGSTVVPLDIPGDGTFFGGLENHDALLFVIDVEDAGGATGQVNLFIQDSWCLGEHWDDVVASANITLGTTSGVQRFVVQGRIATSITQGSANSDGSLSAGTVRSGPFGDRIRIVEEVSGASGTPSGCVYSVYMITCRSIKN